MPKASDYTWIRRYGQYMGSYDSYICDQQEQAAAENAPLNAIRKDDAASTWKTTDDILNVEMRLNMGLPAEVPGEVGKRVTVSVTVAYRHDDYDLAYGLPDGSARAPEEIRALVEAAVAERLNSLGWGILAYRVKPDGVTPCREQEMKPLEENWRDIFESIHG